MSGPALMSAPEHRVPSSSQPRFGASSLHDAGVPGEVRSRPDPNAPTAITNGTTATINAYGPTRSSPASKKTAQAITRSNPSRAIIML